MEDSISNNSTTVREKKSSTMSIIDPSLLLHPRNLHSPRRSSSTSFNNIGLDSSRRKSALTEDQSPSGQSRLSIKSKLKSTGFLKRYEAYLFFKNMLKGDTEAKPKTDALGKNDYPLAYKFNSSYMNELFSSVFQDYLNGQGTTQDLLNAKNFPNIYPKLAEKSKSQMLFSLSNRKEEIGRPAVNRKRTRNLTFMPTKKEVAQTNETNAFKDENKFFDSKPPEGISDHFKKIKNVIDKKVNQKKKLKEIIEKQTEHYAISLEDPKFLTHFYMMYNEFVDKIHNKDKFNETLDEILSNTHFTQNFILKSFTLRKEIPDRRSDSNTSNYL